MNTYYIYYICGTSTIAFYSNEAPTYPGFYISFNSGVDPEFINVCFHVNSINLPVEPASYVEIDWVTASYNTYPDCAGCEAAAGIQYILENCNDPLDTICLQGVYSPGIFVNYNNTCYEIKEGTCAEGQIPQVISINNPFKTCPACQESLPQTNYKLTNCITGTITYTSSDLSNVVGSYVQFNEFEGCYYVEIFPEAITPGPDVSVNGFPYADCPSCNADYYILTDCRSLQDPIITTTDLSAYVGEIIVIEGCPDTCWEVQPTEPAPNPVAVEVIGDPYEGCTECLLAILECRCQSIFNSSEIANAIRYIDCNGDEQSFLLEPETRSDKYCVLYWISGTNPIDYGACTGNYAEKVWACPTTTRPRRKVKPGYNTPACTPEYYEKVECNFSEWMYKDVLQKRYGISNCCPEDLMKWEIKHEMLMLDVLVNPDYVCGPANTCGCSEPCNCGYISLGIKYPLCPSE